VSERLSIQGRVEIEGLYEGVGREQARCEGFLELSDQSRGLQSSKEEEIT
jgi:hypothetical protein